MTIIDDYCYLDGKAVNKVDWSIPYILVVGAKAIGKGVYSKAMSKFNSGIQYLTVQSLNEVHATFREHANAIILIQEVNK